MSEPDINIVRKALFSVWQLVVAPLIVAGLVGLAGWLWYLDRTSAVNASRLDAVESAVKSIDPKLDKIGAQLSDLQRQVDRLPK